MEYYIAWFDLFQYLPSISSSFIFGWAPQNFTKPPALASVLEICQFNIDFTLFGHVEDHFVFSFERFYYKKLHSTKEM